MPPVYEWKCQKCQKVHEVYRALKDYQLGVDCCGKPTQRYFQGSYQVTPDIEPYMTVAADKQTQKRVYISSRREHRDFLRRNGYVEIGNEKAPFYKGKRESEHG